jgi:lysophospholipase L1-like esterase
VPYLCSITPTLRDNDYDLHAAEYDKILREVARRRGIVVIDVREAFTRVDRGYILADLLLPDGLHLSAAGHRLYAETVMRVLA